MAILYVLLGQRIQSEIRFATSFEYFGIYRPWDTKVVLWYGDVSPARMGVTSIVV